MYQQLFVFQLTAVCFQSVEELKGRVCVLVGGTWARSLSDTRYSIHTVRLKLTPPWAVCMLQACANCFRIHDHRVYGHAAHLMTGEVPKHHTCPSQSALMGKIKPSAINRKWVQHQKHQQNSELVEKVLIGSHLLSLLLLMFSGTCFPSTGMCSPKKRL